PAVRIGLALILNRVATGGADGARAATVDPILVSVDHEVRAGGLGDLNAGLVRNRDIEVVFAHADAPRFSGAPRRPIGPSTTHTVIGQRDGVPLTGVVDRARGGPDDELGVAEHEETRVGSPAPKRAVRL